MPKSRRDRQISLTKVQKKAGLEYKNKHVAIIREALKEYERFITFSTDNARNKVIKQLRLEWADDSRFFYTKNSLIKLAFGKDVESEVLKGLSKFGNRVERNIGLLMTNKTVPDLQQAIDVYNEYDYARHGTKSICTVIVKKGPLNEFVTHSEEPYLRTKLNLPVKLDKGIVHMLEDRSICRMGDILTVDKCLQLKTFKVKLAEFRINLDAVYEKSTQDVTIFDQDDEDTRSLAHLTYNTITIEDGDYKYEWLEDASGTMDI